MSSAIYNATLRPLRFVTCLLGFSYTLQLTAARRVLPWKYLHMLVVCGLICFASYQHLVRIRRSPYGTAQIDIYSRILDFLSVGVLCGTHVVAQVEHSCKSAQCASIFRALERLRLQLRRDLQVKVDLQVPKRYSAQLYLLLAIYCGTMLLLIGLLSSNGMPAGRLFFTYYTEVVLRAKFCEVVVLVMLVSTMLREVHGATRKLVQQLEATRFDEWQQRRCCLARIFALQDAHATLWEVVRLIDDYVAWTLPGLVLKQFLDTTLLLYWTYLTLAVEGAVVRIYCITLIVLQLVTMWVAAIVCGNCEKWDSKIKALLHGVATDRRNPYLGACLRRISLQLLHEPLNLATGGFVDINTSTFSKFLFSVIMYTVILIQFRMSVDNEKPSLGKV